MWKYTEYTAALEGAVEKVCSSEYEQAFERVARENAASIPISDIPMLSHSPNTISWYEGDRRAEIIDRFRRSHMDWFNRFLTEEYTGQPPYTAWNSSTQSIMLNLGNLFYRIDMGDTINDQEIRNGFQRTINTIVGILRTVAQFNPVTIDPAALPLVREMLLFLFYFTLDTQLAVYLKSLHVVNLINDLIQTSNEDNEVHLHAYRILAVIMAEEDIKKLQNSHRIASVFLTYMDQCFNDIDTSEARLHNILRSLKVLTQHDQIREELIKQDGPRRFLRCALSNGFHPVQAKLPALEILLALAFNKDFAKQLKNNSNFMDEIRKLASVSESDLQPVATALIWKLEKEAEALKKKSISEEPTRSETAPSASKKTYDIMISYSHSDKQLCHRLLADLEKDQYRVWIDSQSMHGVTFDAMANAIENSEFVFLCMSDAYKQSAFCQMEASYALKRRCHVIPLVMTLNYKADGWLGILTSPFIYVNFPKLGYERAYEELKKQMQLIRHRESLSTNPKPLEPLEHESVPPEPTVAEKPANKPAMKTPRPVVSYPHCIDAWTTDHVESFLAEKNLDVLLPALEGMNGQLLHQAYNMCRANQQGMFLSLKEEIGRTRQMTLTLKDYLIFLDALKIYVPMSTVETSNLTSALCNLM